jgi:hypothetical protein
VTESERYGDRVLNEIIGTGKEEATEGWREMHNEKLHSLHSLENIVRLIR